MRDRYHTRLTDIGSRLAGAALIATGWSAIRILAALPSPPALLAFALAAVAFVCASAGAVLLSLGHHLFDHIEISERWSRIQSRSVGAQLRHPEPTRHARWRILARARSADPGSLSTLIAVGDPSASTFVLARSGDGRWLLEAGWGYIEKQFGSLKAALTFVGEAAAQLGGATVVISCAPQRLNRLVAIED